MLSLSTCLVALAVGMPGDIEVIKFTADWCGPCRAMEPVLDELKRQGIMVRSIDVDAKPDVAQRYRVESLPTIFLVANGRIVDRIDGSVTLEALQSRISQAALLLPTHAQTEQAAGDSGSALRSRERTRGSLANGRRSETASRANREPSNSARPNSARLNQPRSNAAPLDRSEAERIALEASVRLKVEDPQGHSYGSGTIVDVHGKEALILTCGHVFRDSKGKGKITVDLFARGVAASVPGQVIRYDLDRDLALVVAETDLPLRPAVVAGPAYHVAPGQRLFSVGCDRGRDPSIIRGQLKEVNKYLGPENLVVSGRPVDGRSGGGLFSYDGRLVGVCNAADPEIDEGLYAAFASVHRHLDEAKLGFVYRGNGNQRATQVAGRDQTRGDRTQGAAPRRSATRGAPPQLASNEFGPQRSVRDALNGRLSRDRNVRQASSTSELDRRQTMVSTPDRLAGGRTPIAPDDAEIICIIRRNGQPRSEAEVVVLDRPSRQFLAQLNEEQSEQENRQMTELRVQRESRRAR